MTDGYLRIRYIFLKEDPDKTEDPVLTDVASQGNNQPGSREPYGPFPLWQTVYFIADVGSEAV
ncbi:MAG: hypothetical protein KKE44_18530 [Proteobacteria bacterium]|nr:hypothetical protein [Pseudomonadota bacterium]MBU1584730.1 hypothetical protein [Pseudomonadota bacterium]MBU2630861.1 hypothetical protein [Pseudomonadota bacterium]